MSLVTVADVRELVTTALTDASLQAIIDREETALLRKLGPHGNGSTSITETHRSGADTLFLRRPAASVSSITANGVAVSASAYTVWLATGEIEVSASLMSPVVVTYVPADDQAERKRVIIELVRIALERTAMRGESIAGEYSYQAADWERDRARLYRQLTYMEV